MAERTLSSFINRFRSLSTSSRSTVGAGCKHNDELEDLTRCSLTVGSLYNTIQELAVFPRCSSSSVKQGGVVWLRHII